MIYPTARPIMLVAAGAPVALVAGLLRPELWIVALGWMMFVALLVAIDALTGAIPDQADLTVRVPRSAGVGQAFTLDVTARHPKAALPADTHVAIALDQRLQADGRVEAPLGPVDSPGGNDSAGDNGGDGESDGERHARFSLLGDRRGVAKIESGWLRWRGNLGMVWKQAFFPINRDVAITPSTHAVHQDGIRLFMRDAIFGTLAQLRAGEGSEFDRLKEYQPGMDRRAIDWKQSARHNSLLAKEFRTERNNRIVLAIDSGRTMCEPVDGIPKVDRAVSAALLTAFIGLKSNDRISLFSFAGKPQVASGIYSNTRDFGALQRAAARIDYHFEETNYTLGLTTLGASLDHRSLIILFTEFTDPTSAELMLKSAGRLVNRHVILCMVMTDKELDAEIARTPESAGDITRANMAAEMQRDRKITISRLRRMGVHVVEAPHDAMNAKLVDAYLTIKRRNLI
ncbi:DUF58 domain-containing protein [Pseudonocardia sp. TMWB2A]